MSVESPSHNASYLLQIDQVGSFRLILSDRVVLSGPTPLNSVRLNSVKAANETASSENFAQTVSRQTVSTQTVQFLAPLAREHAVIQRVSNGYTLKPVHGLVQREPGEKQDKNTEKPTGTSYSCLTGESLLIQGEHLTLTDGVSFCLREKSPLCRTAVLEVSESDRLKDEVDGVVLMDQLLILGPGKQSNICCSHWPFTGALVSRNGQFSFHLLGGQLSEEKTSEKTPEEKQTAESFALSVPLKKHVCYEEAGFYLEPYL